MEKKKMFSKRELKNALMEVLFEKDIKNCLQFQYRSGSESDFYYEIANNVVNEIATRFFEK